VDGTYVPRLKAVCSWASAIDNSYTDILAQTFNKPVQFQAGEYDSTYGPTAMHAYKAFPPPKGFLGMTGGNHQGPYSYDGMISFFIRYLCHDAAYDTYLYGDGAMNDAAKLTYALNFTLPDGSYFPPNILVSANKTLVVEDEAVGFNLTYDGYVPLGYPNGSFKWDLNGDGQADPAAPNGTRASFGYNFAGVVRPSAWFEIGSLRLRMNRTIALTVTNPAPVVELGGNLSTSEDSALDFTAEVNDTSSDIGTLRYAWDLGDGSSVPYGKALPASHAYRNAGNYTVKLSVKDDEGAETSDSIIVTVANVRPNAQAPANLTADKDQELAFVGSGTDTASDRDKLLYRWTFGDGTQQDWSSDPTAVHTYTGSGNFTVVFEAQDDEGAIGQCTVAVHVADQPPIPAITAPLSGPIPRKDQDIDFGGTATDSPTDAPFLQFCWDFGDQNVTEWANRAAATHAYTRGGHYTVFLRVRDPDGAVGETSLDIQVINQPPEVSMVSPAQGLPQEDEKIVFRAEGTDTPSDIDSLNYTWDIDGGTYYGERVELAFTTEGKHTYKVTVTDQEGAAASASGVVDVADVVPRLSANLFPETIFANESVGFSADAQDTASDRAALKFHWEFGDGSFSDERAGSHVYARPGKFAVKVTVADDEGAARSSGFTVTVNARPAAVTAPDDGGETVQSTIISAYLMAAGMVAVICIVAASALLWRRKTR
jgi:PKD repeat protein